MWRYNGSRFEITTVSNGRASKSLSEHEAQEVEGSIQIQATGWSWRSCAEAVLQRWKY